jgi:hypothetical protein
VAVAEGTFPAGSFVVPMDQPYRNYAVDLLAPQHFPEDAESQPYDDVSWALPVHYGLAAVPIADARIRSLASAPVDDDVHAAGHVTGGGPDFLLRDTGQEGLLAARYRLGDRKVDIAERPFRAGGIDYPAGSWIVAGGSGVTAAVHSVASDLGLDFAGAAAVADVPRHAAPLPRLGVWVPWADTDSIGWIRLTLDRRLVPYTYLRDEDLRAGHLKDRVDVILYGHVDLDLQGQIHGLLATEGPLPFRKTEATPNLGLPASSDDITGGPGFAGLEALQRFVSEGGLLVTMGNGSALALEGGLVRSVRRSRLDVTTPGSELRATFDRPDHPIAYGYARDTSVFRTPLPVYDAPRRWLRMAYCTGCLDGPEDRAPIVLEWGAAGQPLVVSGGVKGGDALAGHPAILDVASGHGHVVVFNFNPLHRDLNRSDHRLLWNAILNWKAIVSP